MDLVLAGHGKPVRDAPGPGRGQPRGGARAHRAGARCRSPTEARTPFEIVPALLGVDELTPMMLNWGLSETLCYLRHLELERGGRVREKLDGAATGERGRAIG